MGINSVNQGTIHSCGICLDDLPNDKAEGAIQYRKIKNDSGNSNEDKAKVKVLKPKSDETACKALKCSHIFHRNCIKTWFGAERNLKKLSLTCPTCRADHKKLNTSPEQRELGQIRLEQHVFGDPEPANTTPQVNGESTSQDPRSLFSRSINPSASISATPLPLTMQDFNPLLSQLSTNQNNSVNEINSQIVQNISSTVERLISEHQTNSLMEIYSSVQIMLSRMGAPALSQNWTIVEQNPVEIEVQVEAEIEVQVEAEHETSTEIAPENQVSLTPNEIRDLEFEYLNLLDRIRTGGPDRDPEIGRRINEIQQRLEWNRRQNAGESFGDEIDIMLDPTAIVDYSHGSNPSPVARMSDNEIEEKITELQSERDRLLEEQMDQDVMERYVELGMEIDELKNELILRSNPAMESVD